MTLHRGWELPESHLLPDAVVAFVDQELSLGAHDRAAAHLAHCPSCAAEVAAQRAASAAVRHAQVPSISAGFLASLRAIPDHTDLPTTPDGLAMGRDGQFVTVQRSDRVAHDNAPNGPLGSTAPLGTSPNVLGNGTRLGLVRRRAAQGAGVVVSGLVLSALALVTTSSTGGTKAEMGTKPDGVPPSADVLRAQMGGNGLSSSVTMVTPSPPTTDTTMTATTVAEPARGPR